MRLRLSALAACCMLSCAVQAQDSALFGRLLTAVDTASVDILPEARLSNVVAKRKAASLRATINDLF